MKIHVEIMRLSGDAIIPEYAHSDDSGCDLFSVEDVVISSGKHKLVKTGIKVAIPEGFEAQVRSKSGLALKQGLFVLNSPGTIDAGYRGEICVILANFSEQSINIEKGQKVAQMVIAPVFQAAFDEVGGLVETDRNAGGFGSTGLTNKSN
jgi:dUTP pyrophosphatase